MTEPVPILLVPGLLCSPRLFAPQLPELWRRGPVTIADHTRDDTMAAVARRILDAAPPRFALAGLSMGGYVALEMVRQAPERVGRLALLDTSARPDRPDQTERRLAQIALADGGRFGEVPDQLLPLLVHPAHVDDQGLRDVIRAMADDVGPAAFVRQQRAIMSRPDSRPGLAGIACPTLVLAGEADQLTPPELAEEMAGAIPGAVLAIVPGAGHASTLEQPDAVTRALAGWLEAT